MKRKLQFPTPEEFEEQWRKGDEERRIWARENQPAIATLKAKLFAIGGSRISPQPCPFVSEIASYGRLFSLPVTPRRMEAIRCHHNVACLWEQRKKRPRLKAIATGYALCEDGTWRPHSWGLSATHILETTVSRLQYFGIPMNAEDADAFAAGFLCQTRTAFNAKLEQLKLLR